MLVELLDGKVDHMSRKDLEKILKMAGFKDKTRQFAHTHEELTISYIPYSHPLLGDGEKVIVSLPKENRIEGDELEKIRKKLDSLLKAHPDICNPVTASENGVYWTNAIEDTDSVPLGGTNGKMFK